MNEQQLVAFELGFDMARYGRDVPDDAPDCCCDGYRTGHRQHPYPSKANRFIHKWLQIRMNALLRGKRVDAEISAAYIEHIDVERCPVTDELLTHSTGTASDWSIDRCNNHRGYVPGNLVVMSTHANKAKADLAFADIVANAKRATPTGGLSLEEWQRMALVVAPAERVAHGEPPARYLLGEPFVPGQPYGLPAQVQAALLEGVHTHGQTDGFDECINAVYAVSLGAKSARRAFDTLMKDMFRRIVCQGRGWDYWQLGRPLRLFIEFWVTLSPGMRDTIGAEIGFVPAQSVYRAESLRATRH